jgi:hypothetical protein
MMKKLAWMLAFSLMLIGTVHAATVEFAATLTPEQEVTATPVASGGSGTAGLVFDTLTNNLGWVISFQDLTSNVLFAHFHFGAPGTNGPVRVDLGDLDVFGGASAIGKMSGIFVGGKTALSGADAADLMAGNWYINIHTSMFPGGEIRGQILSGTFTPVPLPAAVWLMVPALGALGLRRRTA